MTEEMITEARPAPPVTAAPNGVVPEEGVDSARTMLDFTLLIEPSADEMQATPREIKEMADSILIWGLMNALIVEPVSTLSGGIRYRIHAGRRRYAGLKELRSREGVDARRFRFIPVTLMNNLPSAKAGAVLTLMENERRSPNPLADTKALLELVEGGYSPTDISRLTGMHPNRQKQRLLLAGLIPEMRDLLNNRRLVVSRAEEIAKMPQSEQERVLDFYLGRVSVETEQEAADPKQRVNLNLTAKDVDNAKRVRHESAVTAILPELGDLSVLGDGITETQPIFTQPHWTMEAAALLQRLESLFAENGREGEIGSLCEQAMDLISLSAVREETNVEDSAIAGS